MLTCWDTLLICIGKLRSWKSNDVSDCMRYQFCNNVRQLSVVRSFAAGDIIAMKVNMLLVNVSMVCGHLKGGNGGINSAASTRWQLLVVIISVEFVVISVGIDPWSQQQIFWYSIGCEVFTKCKVLLSSNQCPIWNSEECAQADQGSDLWFHLAKKLNLNRVSTSWSPFVWQGQVQGEEIALMHLGLFSMFVGRERENVLVKLGWQF